MRKAPIDYNAYTEDELLSMKKREAIEGLTEQQQRFCEYYIEGHNKRLALIKAGYNQKSETYVTRECFAFLLISNQSRFRIMALFTLRMIG